MISVTDDLQNTRFIEKRPLFPCIDHELSVSLHIRYLSLHHSKSEAYHHRRTLSL